MQSDANRWKTGADEATNQFNATDQIGQHLVGNVEGRFLWLELLRVIDVCLPHDLAARPRAANRLTEKDIDQRNRLYVSSLDCQYFENLSDWFGKVQSWYQPGPGEAPIAAGPRRRRFRSGRQSGHRELRGANRALHREADPKGQAGWCRLKGYHFHNGDKYPPDEQGAAFVRKTFINNLRTRSVELPLGNRKGKEIVNVKDLGISFPVLKDPGQIKTVTWSIRTPRTTRAPIAMRAAKMVDAQQVRFHGGVRLAADASQRTPPEAASGAEQCKSSPK